MRVIHALREFVAFESAGGILLAITAVAALTLANSPLAFLYDAFLDTPVEVRVGTLQIAKPLLLWINDGLMAVFFFLVGLEIKRDVLEGELSDPRQVVLPAAWRCSPAWISSSACATCAHREFRSMKPSWKVRSRGCGRCS